MNRTKNNSYTNIFKIKVVEKALECGSNRKAAALYGIHEKNIRRWKLILPAIKEAARMSRITSARRRGKWPLLEKEVCTFIDNRRRRGVGVSRALIRLEALKVAGKLKIKEFKASEGWCTKFMRRHSYSIRRPTKIAQKLPKHHENKIIDFQRFVIRHRHQNNYELSCIGNMDETPVYQDMLPATTVNKKGEKTVILKSTGHEKNRYTVVLACMADGTKLPPMIIYKRTMRPKGNFPKDVKLHWNAKGWVDEDACKLWVKDIWTKRPGGYFKPRSLLVWDKFSAHLTEGVRKTLDDTKTDIAVIPGGLTSILQPLDVSLNKPFKDELRKRWTAWMAAESYTLTAGGNMRAPPLDTQAHWVKDSWDAIRVPTIVKSFKKCCISNAMDGTEDDILWQHEEINDTDEPVVEVQEETTDPHDDEIPEAEYQELFFGEHEDDNDDDNDDDGDDDDGGSDNDS